MAIKRVAPPIDRAPKIAAKFIGPYCIKSVLKNDRILVVDIPGCCRSQRAYQGILSAERLKPWASGELFSDNEHPEDSSDDELSDPCDALSRMADCDIESDKAHAQSLQLCSDNIGILISNK